MKKRRRRAHLDLMSPPLSEGESRTKAGFHFPHVAGVLLVIACAIVPFLPSLNNAFVWDDHGLIERNPALERPLASFGRLVGIEDIRSPYYRPLAILWWSLQRVLLGLDARGFHVWNILLHAAATVLVLAIARRLMPALPALTAALVFGLHPVHVEAVAFASAGATELLPAVLFLAALWLVLPREDPAGEPARFWGAAALYLLALLAKEVAIGLPVLATGILVNQRRSQGGAWRETARRLLPFGVATAVYGLLRIQAMLRPDPRLPVGANPFSAWHVPAWLSAALQALLTPSSTIPFYNLLPLTALQLLQLGVLLAVVVFVLWRIGKSLRWNLAVLLGLGLLLVTFLPSAPLLPRSGALMADRFLYLPSSGFALLVGCGVTVAAEHLPHAARAAGVALFACVFALMGGWTYVRVGDWRDDRTLATGALVRDPRNTRVLIILSRLHMQLNETEAAERRLLEALAIDPGLWEAQISLAQCYQLEKKRLGEAEQLYRRALAEPSPRVQALAWFGLGSLKLHAGTGDRGEGEFLKALQFNPALSDAYLNLGEITYRKGDLVAATGLWERGLAIDPNNAKILSNLGALAQDRGDVEASRGYLRRAEQASPDDVQVLVLLARQRIKTHEFPEAERLLLRASTLSPHYNDALLKLADCYRMQGKMTEAGTIYRRMIEADPQVAEAWFGLGSLKMQLGDAEQGEREFLEASRLDPSLVEAHVNLGDIAYQRRDLAGAARQWETGLALDPTNALLLNNLGVIAKARGDLVGARSFFDRALAKDPAFAQARRNLAGLPPAPAAR